MAKSYPDFHHDIIGQEIRVGDIVAAPLRGGYSSTLTIARIVKVTPKKVNLIGLKDKNEWSIWANETAKLNSEDVLAFILKYE
jgi:hypothetical protein